MTKEYIEKEMAKAGLKSFMHYLRVIYNVSYDTFTRWPKDEKDAAMKDFFNN